METTLRDDQTITLLVNNAGVGSIAPLLDADAEQMDDMIALNVTALTRLTYAAVPAFVARGAGTIINTASVVGISPETLNGVYGATKAFVLWDHWPIPAASLAARGTMGQMVPQAPRHYRRSAARWRRRGGSLLATWIRSDDADRICR
jgi:NAD(P)-dependent dehydrogenase (short-subunit alcohol dehydrogenase family)